MRVLVLTKGLAVGGAEVLIETSSRCWDRDNFDYHLAFLDPRLDELAPRMTDRGLSVVALRGISPGGFVALRGLIRRLQPDLIHAHLPVAGVMARVLAKGTPVVYTEHNVVHSYRPATRYANRLTYRANTAVIAVSAAVRDSVAGYPGPSPVVIPNGIEFSVPTATRQEVRRRLDVPSDSTLIVHVGHVRPGKGHRNLIDAFRIVHDHVPEAILLSMGAYQDAALRRDLEAFETTTDGAFRSLGFRTDVRDILGAADMFVNPSEVEGLPLTVLEAMSASVPVVATRAGGVPEVVENGISGLLVQINDSGALASAMLELLSMPDVGAALARRGNAKVRDGYDIASNVEATEALYRGIVA